jgi:lipid-A-disaccharide synthase
MKLFFSAGEPSGDLHGANLIHTLRSRDPNISITGFGGPKMTAAGAELLYPLTELAVMGIRQALRHVPAFIGLAAQAERYFRVNRPDAVVLIDYPGFNFVVAERAHAAGIPVYYFVPPQLWAWRRGRVRAVRRWCAGVLTSLPFEDDWYRSRGVATHYIGHPYFDELAKQQLDAVFLAEQRRTGTTIIGLLPGSRNQEVALNFSTMLATAQKVQNAYPAVRYLVAAYNDRHAAVIREAIRPSGLPIEVHVGRTPEIIELADMCVAVSGSVSLELMYRAKPTFIVYRMSPVALWIARRLIKLPSITLVNLLAKERLFPEVATSRDESDLIAPQLLRWLTDSKEREAVVSRLTALRDRIVVPGACERAAEFLLAAVARRSAA